MSVGSVSSGIPDLYNVLQQVSGNGQPANPTAPADPTATQSNEQVEPHHGHHHHGGGGKLQSQIQSAVTTALKNASPSDDPNKIVQNAIAGVLKANNPNAAPANGAANSAASASTADPSATSTSAADKQQFDQLLQSFGVDPKAFHADFQAAVADAKNANTTSTDPTTLFGSFPPGSNVDTQA